MIKIFLMVMLAVAVNAAQLEVAASGGDYTTVSASMAGLSNGDTVHIADGYSYVDTTRIDPPYGSTGITIIGHDDTIYTGAGRTMMKLSDGAHINVHNIVFADTCASCGWHNFFEQTTSSIGHEDTFTNCKFITYSNSGKFQLGKGASDHNYGVVFIDCEFTGGYVGLDENTGYDKSIMSEYTRYTRCKFFNVAVEFGNHAEMTDCYDSLRSGVDNKKPGDSVTIRGTYFCGPGDHGTYISTEISATSARSTGARIINNVFGPNGHVGIMLDHDHDVFIDSCRFYPQDVTNIFCHNNISNDTSAKDIVIQRCRLTGAEGGSGSNISFYPDIASKSYRASVKNCYVLNDGYIRFDSTDLDTVSKVYFSGETVTFTSVSSVSDTGRNVTGVLTDTVYGFFKQKKNSNVLNPAYTSASDFSNWETFLVKKSSASSKTTSGFSVACTLSSGFWLRNNYTKDSINIIFETATDTASTITIRDSTGKVKAGTADVLAATGLSSGTKYFWRVRTPAPVADTSFWDTATTVSAANQTAWHVDTSGSDVTGTGTAVNPYRTPRKAIDSLFPGDTCFIHRGATWSYTDSFLLNSTHGRSGTADSPIVYMSYNSDTVTITAGISAFPANLDGDPVPPFCLGQKSYLKFVGPMVIDSGFRACFQINDDNANADSIKTCHNLTFENIQFRRVWGSSNSGCFWNGIITDHNDSMADSITFTGCYFGGVIDTTNGGNHRASGWYGEWPKTTTWYNCIFENVPVGIHVKQENKNNSAWVCLVDSSIIRNCSFRGILLRGGSYWNINNMIFKNVANAAEDAIAIQLFDNDTGYCKVDSNTINHVSIIDCDNGINLHQGDNWRWPKNTTIKNTMCYQYLDGLRAYSIWDYSGQDSSNTALHHSLAFSDHVADRDVYHLSSYYRLDSLPAAVTPQNGNLVTRPIFTDSAAGDFTLTAASPGYHAADDGLNMGFTTGSESGGTPSYTLTVTDNGAGGTITPEGVVSVDSGAGTAIEATAATHYHFSVWRVTSGTATIADSNDATTTCTLSTGNATVSAIFVQHAYTLFERMLDTAGTVTHHWNGDTASGKYTDVVGDSNATPGAGVTRVARKQGFGVSCSSNTSVVNLSAGRIPATKNKFTICGFSELNNRAVNSAFWGKYHSNYHNINMIYSTSLNAIYIEVNNSPTYGACYASVGSLFPTGKEVFWAVLIDLAGATNADRVKLFLNDRFVELTFASNIPTSLSADVDDDPFTIAYYAGTVQYRGYIDEVAIYNDQALTEHNLFKMSLYAQNKLNDTLPFIFTINTENTDSTDTLSFVLPQAATTYNFYTLWGDGSHTITTTNTGVTHNYATPGIYDVQVIENSVGGFPMIYFADAGDKLKITDIKKFGDNTWASFWNAFNGCTNMGVSARDGMDIKGSPVDWRYAFNRCLPIDTLIINTHTGTDLSYAFSYDSNMTYLSCDWTHAQILDRTCQYATKMANISFVSLENVTSMNGTFQFAPITSLPDYPTIHLKNTSFLFRNTRLTELPPWDYDSVYDAMEMCVEGHEFRKIVADMPLCTSFAWFALNAGVCDTVAITGSNIKNFYSAFKNMDSLKYFSVDMRSMNNGEYCFDSTRLTAATYSAILDTLAEHNTNEDVLFHGGWSKYLNASQDSRDTLTVNRGWTITDSGVFDPTYSVTGTDVGNGSHAFLPANDSVAESGGTVRIYGTADAGNVFSGFSGDTAGMVRVGDTATFTMTSNRAITLTFTAIPVIDSIRKNPNYRNDSSSIYLRGGSSAGVVRNLTTGTNVLQKYWSDTRIDVYTGNWSRGWHQIRVTTEDSLRDTASLYIAIPRKTN